MIIQRWHTVYNILILLMVPVAVQSAGVEKKSLPSQTGVVPHQMNSPLMLVESFLQALTNADKDGRIVIARKGTLFGLKKSKFFTVLWILNKFFIRELNPIHKIVK